MLVKWYLGELAENIIITYDEHNAKLMLYIYIFFFTVLIKVVKRLSSLFIYFFALALKEKVLNCYTVTFSLEVHIVCTAVLEATNPSAHEPATTEQLVISQW